MSGYQRVNAHDADETSSPREFSPRHVSIPDSPPPSFHSRASSPLRAANRSGNVVETRPRASGPVDPALADAFDTDSDESDDDADDRQRLVRGPREQNSGVSGIPVPTSDAAVTAPSTSALNPAAAAAAAPGAARRTTRVYGGGIQSDGVFSNLTAKPEAGVEKDEQPPTYEQAAADSAPPYWETTILAPGLGGPDEVYVDGMPVGSVFSFVWNGMISMSFQVVGFLLTYLLHSTHAAKNGSRAGLGITLIQYGFYMQGSDDEGGGSGGASSTSSSSSHASPDGYASPPDPNSHSFNPGDVSKGHGGMVSGSDGSGSSSGGGGGLAEMASSEWVAYALMIVGWFILIRAVSDYVRARRHEQLVLQSPDRGLGVAVIAEGENPEHVV